MGGAARTVSKWIPNEIKSAIPVEISKAIPKEIAAADAAQAQQTYDIQHPDTFGQVTFNSAISPEMGVTQRIGPTSAGGAAPMTFSAPTPMTKTVNNSPVYNRPGAGAALTQQAQDQSNFRLPSVSGLTFGGS